MGEGEFVVARRRPAPLLEGGERSFDNVAALVLLGVESGGAAAAAAPPVTVASLVVRLGDDRLDASRPEVGAGRSRRVGLVRENGAGRVRGRPGPIRGTDNAPIRIGNIGESPA